MKKSLFILIALFSLSLSAKQEKPNILFIVSEDNGYNYTSFAGNKNALHPTLDKLASEGIVFDRAYSNGAVCAVARSTMITGMYASSLGTTHMRSQYPIPKFIDTYAKLFRDNGYYASNHSKTDYNTSSISTKIWDKSAGSNFIQDKPKGKPFIAVFNIMQSHESKIFPNAQKGSKKLRVDTNDVELAPFYPDTPQMRKDIAFYHECLTNMDKEVQKVLDQLEKDGTKDDTFIIYASDHGGILPRSKRYLEDTGTHIPLIIVTPKNWQEYALADAGTRSNQIVSLVDIPATMLSIAGIEVPEYMEGRALMGKYKSAEKSKYSYLYSGRYDGETHFCFRRAITDGTYRYIRDFLSFVPYALNCEYPYRQAGAASWVEEYEKGNLNEMQSKYFKSLGIADLLYNTPQDKWEVDNLAQKDPKKLAEMKQDLYNIMLETKDAGVLPEAFFHNMNVGECVYEYVRRDDFDYENVLKLAWKSGDRDPKDIPFFEENLKSPNSTKRFWAIMGLANLGIKAESAVAELKELLQVDSEVANRIASALAIHTISGDERMTLFLDNIKDDYIKEAEPSATLTKGAFLKSYAEGANSIIKKKIPLIGAMMYLNSFSLSPSAVIKYPYPEPRVTGSAKKVAEKKAQEEGRKKEEQEKAKKK